MKTYIKIPNNNIAFRLFKIMDRLYDTPETNILHDTEVLQVIWEQLANSKNAQIKKYLNKILKKK